MKSAEVKLGTYTDSLKENNKKDPKLYVGDHARISKYKNIFAKGYVPNCPEEAFVIKKVTVLKILCCRHMLLVTLTVKKSLESLTKKIAKDKSNRI